MKIAHIRLLNLVFVLILLTLGKPTLLVYIFFNHVLLELLNALPRYKQHAYRLYNTLFWLYELVLLERLRHFKLNETAEWWLNNMEHICFALDISFVVYILAAIFWLKEEADRFRRAVLVFVLFNVIGLINEWNQNIMGSRPVFTLIPDSVKDMLMNLIGSAIFFCAVMVKIIVERKHVAGSSKTG